MSRKKKESVLALCLGLVAVTLGGVLFVGAVAGWFHPRVALDAEYLPSSTTLELQDGEYIELLTAARYDELAEQGKSFIVFVDQAACQNAERLRGYLHDYMAETGVKVYRMMFSEVKGSRLYAAVKYYPSVAVIDKGQPAAWLKADADEFTDEYNDYTAFRSWLMAQY